MEANELRTGNLVKCLGEERELLGITKHNGSNETTLHYAEFKNVIPMKLFHLKPIPLTEKWIKDLGLIKVIGWNDVVFWRLPEDKNSNDCFELMETLQGYELPSGKICEFVHQLQNCYFFHELTGKELILK